MQYPAIRISREQNNSVCVTEGGSPYWTDAEHVVSGREIHIFNTMYVIASALLLGSNHVDNIFFISIPKHLPKREYQAMNKDNNTPLHLAARNDNRWTGAISREGCQSGNV